MRGSNADIWGLIDLELEREKLMPDLSKVTPRAILEQVFTLMNIIERGR